MIQTVLLGDLVNIRSGKSRPKESGGFPVYGGNGIFDSAPTANMDEPTVIVGRVGAYCGSVYIERRPFWLSDNALGVTVKNGSDLNFIYYLLKSIDLNNKSVGGAQPLLTQGILNSISVKVPNLETQKKIADILGTIDEKIELNRRMNETLEQMGQALFRHYFIDNPEAERWERVPISELCEKVASGGTPATKREDYYGGDVQWYSTKELKDGFLFGSEKTITEEGLGNSAAKLFPAQTVMMAIYAAPTVGRLGVLTSKASFNQATCGLVAKEEVGYEFIYLYLLLSRTELNNMANGAAQQNINVGKVRDFKVMSPNEATLSEFRKEIAPIFTTIKNNSEHIQTLTILRDTLLPRLINGKVKV